MRVVNARAAWRERRQLTGPNLAVQVGGPGLLLASQLAPVDEGKTPCP